MTYLVNGVEPTEIICNGVDVTEVWASEAGSPAVQVWTKETHVMTVGYGEDVNDYHYYGFSRVSIIYGIMVPEFLEYASASHYIDSLRARKHDTLDIWNASFSTATFLGNDLRIQVSVIDGPTWTSNIGTSFFGFAEVDAIEMYDYFGARLGTDIHLSIIVIEP